MPDDTALTVQAGGAGASAVDLRRGNYVSNYVLPSQPEVGADEDAVHFRDLWRVILKRKWTILAVFLIIVASAVIATFMMTPTFRPAITLKIERETPKVVEFKDVTPVESAGDRDFYQTQYELLKSRTLAARVLSQLNLKQDRGIGKDEQKPWWDPRTTEAPAPKATSSPDEERRANERAVSAFLGSLTVEPVRNSRLVRVYFTSPDRQLATDVLNTLAQNFISVNLERRYDASSYAKTFLEEKLAQTKVKLEDSERAMVAFQRSNQILNIDDRQTTLSQTMNEFNVAANRAEQERLKADAIYAQFKLSPESSPQVLENKSLQTLKDQRAKMQAEYQDQLKIYKPGFPKMQQLQAAMDEIDKKIKEETDIVKRSIEGTYQAAVQQEATIKVRLEAAKKQVLDLQDRSIRFNILKREVDTNRQLYDGLLQRLKEVGVAGGVGINNISVVDPAEIPQSPYKPSLRQNVLMAMVLGLIAGIGLAFFLEYLDDTLRAPDEMEKLTRLPVLGVVPRIKQGKGEQSLALTAATDARSAFAEAYRSVRTALQFSTREGAPKQLVIASTSAGEGKTTTAVSLAIQFAQAGRLTILVDADLRNSSIHRQLEVDNSRGLSNYLSSDIPALGVVRTTPIPNLFVIPAGPTPPNPVELLSGPKMLQLLTELGDKFGHVIVDSAPVLGIADAIVLGNQVGAMLFVVASGTTRKAHAKAALKRLRQAGVQPVGTLMSKLDLRDGMYGYESAYYYYKSTNNDAPQLARN